MAVEPDGSIVIDMGAGPRRLALDATMADLYAFIEQCLVDGLRADPAIQRHLRREEARILYGTRAFPQLPARHTESRRVKRRRRKARRK